jgi:hypothetical protein
MRRGTTPRQTHGGRRRAIRFLAAGALVSALAVAAALAVPTSGSARAQDAPANITEPKISGSLVEGQTLTATTGTWTNNPTSYAFQWLHCPADGGNGNGSNCDPISGATSSTLLLQASDVGHRLRVKVTAMNNDGSASAASNATDAVASATSAPVNTSEPKITGSPVQGQALTATTGTWSNNPTSFAFQWLHCPQSGGKSDGSDCAAISGATGSSLVLQASDVGFRIRVRVTATNAGGSGSAASNPTTTVTSAGAPTNTALPTISGSPALGQTLVASPGTWTGTQPISYSYQWLRCNSSGAGCLVIAGATTNSHVVVSADVGTTLRIRITAAGPGGSAQATSNQTAVVGSTSSAGCPAGTGPIPVTAITSPARLLISGQQAAPSTVTPQTPTLIVKYHVTACNGRSVIGALVYVTALPYNQLSSSSEVATAANGWATIQLQVKSGFPVSKHQQLLTMFTRARKPGGDLLGGISTRRLFSIHVRV